MRFAAIIVLMTMPAFLSAQTLVNKVLDRVSFDAMLGMSNYIGELQPERYNLAQSKFAFSIGGSIAITNRLSLRGMGSRGSLYAADKHSSNPDDRARNLSFHSYLWDASVVLVYELMDIKRMRFTPYVFGGGSYFAFHPYAYDTAGIKRTLFQRSIEGQGFPEHPDRAFYSRVQFSIPFGAGVRFLINDHLTVGWEIRYHKTFTDYIDDVSTSYVDYALLSSRKEPETVQLAYRGWELHDGAPYPAAGTPRGNPKTKDWIYFSGLTVSYSLSPRKDSNTRMKSRYGCPTISL